MWQYCPLRRAQTVPSPASNLIWTMADASPCRLDRPFRMHIEYDRHCQNLSAPSRTTGRHSLTTAPATKVDVTPELVCNGPAVRCDLTGTTVLLR